jgi:peptidoglycan hydrolase-like protein with peptidoglycan-binding domain
MFFASKIVYSGIVFLLLMTWISGPRPTPPTPTLDVSGELSAGFDSENITRMQQTLFDKGHYSGKIDGVVGLRIRASIRAYQKAERLPVTGDHQTASKLGVKPEGHEETGKETMHDKPSAGIKRAKRSGQSGDKGPSTVKADSNLDSDRREREKKRQAGSENSPQ